MTGSIAWAGAAAVGGGRSPAPGSGCLREVCRRIAREIVRGHRGQIEVRPGERDGNTFTVVLPRDL